MDRRAFITTGAWLSAGGVALPWLTRAVAIPNTLALVDTSVAAGRTFSHDAARRGLAVFDISHESGEDIGTLWHTTLAPRLVTSPGLVIGIVRSSDYFVLGQFALRSGRMIEHQCERCTGPHALVVFMLKPSAPACPSSKSRAAPRPAKTANPATYA